MTSETGEKDVVIRFYEEHPFPDNLSLVASSVPLYRKLLGSRKYRSIVVAGCGTGEELMSLHQLFPEARITAIEPSNASVAVARERCPWAQIQNTTIEEFQASECDLVWSAGVLQHTADPFRNLKRLATWASDGGDVFISVYHHARWDLPQPSSESKLSEAQVLDGSAHPRERTYSWQSFLALLHAAGLRPHRVWHKLRLPVPRGRLMCAAYDGLWLYRRIQMLPALCRRV